MMYDKNRLLSIQDAANYLGISSHTLRSWVKQKKVIFIKLGKRVLFRPDDLVALVAENIVQPQ